MFFKNTVLAFLPEKLISFCAYVFHPMKYYRLHTENEYLSQSYLDKQEKMHKKALERCKSKRTLNCVFFAIYESVWKYDALYRLMEKHDRFNPVILVCPAVNRGKEHMIESLQHCYDSFKQRGYNVIMSYNYENETYVDVRKGLAPDIIFYTNHNIRIIIIYSYSFVL